MSGSALRRLALPVLVTGLVVVGVPRLTGASDPAPPPAPAPLLEDPFTDAATAEQTFVLLGLWDAWGADLAPAEGDAVPELPVELSSLSFEEASYVLLSLRAAQVAEAHAADPAADLATAVAAQGLRPPTPEVAVATVAGTPGCVSVTWPEEPYGRTFYGLAGGTDQPGPEPAGPVEAGLLRTVRVGLGDLDDATCGEGGVAFSPAAQDALLALQPELLTG